MWAIEMAKEARPQKITKRDVAYLARSPKPYQCKRCGKIFRTKHAALTHQCAWHSEVVDGSASQPKPSQPDASTSQSRA